MNTTYYEQTAVLYLDDEAIIPYDAEMTQQISIRRALDAPMRIVRGSPPGIDWRMLRETVKSLFFLATMLVTLFISLPLITRAIGSHTSPTRPISKNMANHSLFEYSVHYQPVFRAAAPNVSINTARRNRKQVFTVDPSAPMTEDGSF